MAEQPWSTDYTTALRVLADIYLEQEQIDKALVLLRALARLAPQDQGIWRAIGLASLRAGEPESALQAADTLLRLDPGMPNNAPALLLRAQALQSLGRLQEAQESLNRYLRLMASDA